jgi:hypothetical protein
MKINVSVTKQPSSGLALLVREQIFLGCKNENKSCPRFLLTHGKNTWLNLSGRECLTLKRIKMEMLLMHWSGGMTYVHHGRFYVYSPNDIYIGDSLLGETLLGETSLGEMSLGEILLWETLLRETLLGESAPYLMVIASVSVTECPASSPAWV